MRITFWFVLKEKVISLKETHLAPKSRQSPNDSWAGWYWWRVVQPNVTLNFHIKVLSLIFSFATNTNLSKNRYDNGETNCYYSTNNIMLSCPHPLVNKQTVFTNFETSG